LRSIHGHIGDAYGRVRLGIGHPGHKDAVAGYVLHDFPKADDAWLDDLLRGIADGAPHLADGDAGKFMNAVALRVAPARSSKSPAKTEKADVPKPAAEPEAEQEPDTRNPLQKLVDRFR
jgi:PTH1 family peptidyl-tRNA hydrolase